MSDPWRFLRHSPGKGSVRLRTSTSGLGTAPLRGLPTNPNLPAGAGSWLPVAHVGCGKRPWPSAREVRWQASRTAAWRRAGEAGMRLLEINLATRAETTPPGSGSDRRPRSPGDAGMNGWVFFTRAPRTRKMVSSSKSEMGFPDEQRRVKLTKRFNGLRQRAH